MGKCLLCGREFEGNFCPNCGKNQTEEREERDLEGFSALKEPQKPETKERVSPPYSYYLALEAGAGKILRYILTFLVLLSDIVLAVVAIRITGSIPSGWFLILGIMLLGGTVFGICVAFNAKSDIRQWCFALDVAFLVPIAVLVFYAICGAGIYFTAKSFDLDKVVYGQAFLRENIIIATITIVVGLASTLFYVVLRLINAPKLRALIGGGRSKKELKNIIYADIKAENAGKIVQKLDLGDGEYLAYKRYLAEVEAYAVLKRMYDRQMVRKAQGKPYKEKIDSNLWLAINLKDLISFIAVICAIVIAVTVLIAAKSFEIKTQRLLYVETTFDLPDGKKFAGSKEKIQELYGVGNNVEELLGKPTVVEVDGKYIEWIYYDKTISKQYARLEEIDEKLKELSAQGKQDEEEYKNLKKEEEDIYTKLLKIESRYRIIVKLEEREDGLTQINSIDYRKATLEEEFFGYQKKEKEIEMRVFSFEREIKVGATGYLDNCQVRTRYADGSFSMVKIPSTALDEVDITTVGVYTVAWEDPIVGEQTVEITVK